jgi:deferrochelatase/peroxidase EfeB|tara:strand:+ start:371 stop:802 length:432 start_codon:yes stop_codon:yes gene_type:complete
MKIKEFIIMPHTADTMGLIHRPGTGPNNRFGFKNSGNNRANEIENEDAAGVGIVTKQNATKDVPKGGEYMNVKKLKLEWAGFNENFADGKKKGKSRPGRVKKSGASCNGSVTSLRARAKKASGEKAKMYHWCANMKSGRKKKK